MKTSVIHNTRIISHSPGKKAYSDNGTRIIKAACEDKQPAINEPLLHVGDDVFGYRIVRYEKQGGEAQIYKAESHGSFFAVKAYTYPKVFDKRVYDTLMAITHKNIAKMVYYGYYNNTPVEVTEYFDGGSLEGKTYKLEELRTIIGQINEGLRYLHSNKLYINDLKPSNVCISSTGKVALIDFSLACIESSTKHSHTLSQGTGTLIDENMLGNKTPGYCSPEYSSLGISSVASDYYSLGIMIFELYFGYPPFNNMDQRNWSKYLTEQIKFMPSSTPKELGFIKMLVTYDPVNRIGYKEIKAFSEGKPVVYKNNSTLSSFSYRINGEDAYDRKSLRDLLAKNWYEGLERLFGGDGDIYNCFNKTKDGDQDIAALARRICDEYRNRKDSELGFLKFLNQLYPDDKRFVWRGRVFESMQQVSDYILDSLRKRRNEKSINDMIGLGVVSFYYDFHNMRQQANAVRTIEHKYIELVKSNKNPYDSDPVINELSLKYAIAFMIASEKKFQIDGNVYTDRQIATNIEAFAKHLTDADGYPTSAYAGYLIAAGKIRTA